MLPLQTAQKVIDQGLGLGADFVEIFVEKSHVTSLDVLSSELDEARSLIDFGIGIRLIYGEKVLYGHTNKTALDELVSLTKLIAAADAKALAALASPLPSMVRSYELATSLDQTTMEEKLRYLMRIDQAARKSSKHISQVEIGLIQKLQEVEIFNSEGLWASEKRPYLRFRVNTVAEDGNMKYEGSENPGATRDWSFAQNLDPEALGKEAARTACVKLNAIPCPAGSMPVILDNAFGGVIFHEACGHLLETTSVAKKASVFHDKLGEMIAHPALSAVDDGTNDGLWGSIKIDDEGMETKRTQLIKDGVLTNFISDRLGAKQVGIERSGSGRRQNYRYAPASRMRNTYIEAGPHSLDELIGSVDHGIYCKKMGGGSVNPGTGEFNFAALESYLIKDGKISAALKGATLIGKGVDIMKRISMVANNLETAAGMCGSVSGAVPVTVGQPALKVDEILVGGQS